MEFWIKVCIGIGIMWIIGMLWLIWEIINAMPAWQDEDI